MEGEYVVEICSLRGTPLQRTSPRSLDAANSLCSFLADELSNELLFRVAPKPEGVTWIYRDVTETGPGNRSRVE